MNEEKLLKEKFKSQMQNCLLEARTLKEGTRKVSQASLLMKRSTVL